LNGIKAFRVATWAAVAVLGGILLANSGWLPGTRPATEAASSGIARVGGPFELTSHKGETVSNETLAGRPYLVFFGFTHCPDICPITLYELTDLMAELGPASRPTTRSSSPSTASSGRNV
jgi:protein SCO1